MFIEKDENILPSKKLIGPAIFFLCAALAAYFVWGLSPAASAKTSAPQTFTVSRGDGFRKIADEFADQKLIRSATAFKIFSVVTGSAYRLKPGVYKLGADMGTPKILGILVAGPDQNIAVRIPEGASLYNIDALLAENGVIRKGSLIAFSASSTEPIEGKLFPDTYQFASGSDARDIVKKFLKNFEAKAAPLLGGDPKTAERDLVIASLLEKEVPDFADRTIVAGILLKRLAAGMPLQVDASVCYAKEIKTPSVPCYPLTAIDLKIDSPYNTYMYKGLPPGPIGNPGIEAIRAAENPKPSPYWFYLSDPVSHKTVFSKTLDDHTQSRVQYLRQ